MVKESLSVLCLVLLAVLPSAAAERVLTFDPGSSSVRFTLDATLHTVHGTLKVTRGRVRFDAVPGPASGEVVVDAVSGATGNDGRDKKMHEQVLLSAKYPEIVFVPRQTSGDLPASGKGTLTVDGVMRVAGTEHAVTLPLQVEVEGATVRVTSTFQVPYVAWGLDDPSVFLLRVGKEVAVEVEASGTLAAAAGQGATPSDGESAAP